MNSINLKALAKINLGLDVIGKRANGYHDVRMVMQTINLYDRLTISKHDGNEIILKTNLSYLPTNEDNLVYRAARLLMDEFQLPKGLYINLEKHIPVAAGLAGGSSDAAATLMGLNLLYELGLSKEQLMERGVKLGADVPYCILQGTALSEGIGEQLTPISPMPNCHIIIAKPDLHVSTKFVYENLKLDDTLLHPDIDGIISCLDTGDFEGLCSRLGNVLESVTIKEYPVIQEIKDCLLKQNAMGALMSGSGPTVFGLYKNYEQAMAAQKALEQSNLVKDLVLTSCYNVRN